MSNDKKEYWRKDLTIAWGTVILLAIIFIAFLSNIYAKNSSALGFVSFAGTIVSILLAVIAIFYSITESSKQSYTVNKVVDGANRIETSSLNIERQINELNSIHELIATATEKIDSVKNDIKEGFDGVGESQRILSDAIKQSKNDVFTSETADSNEARESSTSVAHVVKDNTVSHNNKESAFNTIVNDFNEHVIFGSYCKKVTTSVPFMVLCLALFRGDTFLRIDEIPYYNEMLSPLEGNYIISKEGLPFAMVTIYALFVQTGIMVKTNDTEATFAKGMKELAIDTCRSIYDNRDTIFADDFTAENKAIGMIFEAMQKLTSEK